jgi:hypothetical protein
MPVASQHRPDLDALDSIQHRLPARASLPREPGDRDAPGIQQDDAAGRVSGAEKIRGCSAARCR